MATYTADAAQATVQPKGIRYGTVAKVATWSFPSSGSVGTTVQMIKIPAGATPLAMYVANNNAGQLTVQVGDGNSTGRFYAETTLSSGMGLTFCGASLAPYTYSVDDTIDVVISRVSVSTAGGAVYLHAIYTLDI